MTVDCIIEDQRWVEADIEQRAATAAEATLAHLGLEPSVFEISVLGCDDARIAALNTDFRGKPTATNVLSWPSAERASMAPGEMPVLPSPGPDAELGDIAIAYDTCMAEAKAQNLPLTDHITHLIVHGTLHLLGFDHESDPDAALMEGIETEILGNLGIPDPYSETSA